MICIIEAVVKFQPTCRLWPQVTLYVRRRALLYLFVELIKQKVT